MKKILTICGLLVILALLFLVLSSKKEVMAPVVSEENISKTVDMCYFYDEVNANGLFDRAWLKMYITDNTKISGEYYNLPAEKDSKFGTFTGVAGALDQKKMARTAELWWSSMAEGMEVKEELNVEFGDGSAVALFGEMVDRGDGAYVYKDKTKLTSGFSMSQMDCVELDGLLKKLKNL